MYVSTQIRGEDLEEFFSHETLQYPPSLSKCGEMCCSNKSDLVKHIEPSAESANAAPGVTAAAWEGLLLVNMTKPNKNQSLKSYCSDIFFPQLTLYFIMLKNGQTYFKNLAVWTPQDF